MGLIYLLLIPLLFLIALHLAIWAVIFVVFVSIVRPYAASRPRLRKYFYVPMLVLFWWYPIWDLFPGPVFVNWSCEQYGGLRVYADGPVVAEGFTYDGDPVPGRNWGRIYDATTPQRIVDQLQRNRLRYTELKNFRFTGKGERITFYQRTSLERRDSGLCPPANPDSPRPSALNIPEGTCVLSAEVETPSAPVRIGYDPTYITYFPTNISWQRYEIRDRATNRLLAEHRTFGHHLFLGWLTTGTKCEPAMRGIDVFDLDVVRGPRARSG
jgi:hypothetical protein